VGRRRLYLVAAALLVTALKLYFAATTQGSNDVFHFTDFAGFVHRYGPIGIYGHWSAQPPYNHPPLIGWLLAAINWATGLGLPFRFLIRVPATLADIASALLVFELVRIHRSVRDAMVAGLVVAASPVLIIVSGYHGNTDPVFVMFALLSFYLLVTGRSGLAAGLSFGIAVSIKLVPIVTLGVLLVLAARAGWRKSVAFLAGAVAVFALLWVPVILQQWTALRTNVLGYAGYGGRPLWGLPEFFFAAGASQHVLDVLEGPGRFVVLLLCTALPALLAWRRPAASVTAFGLSLSLFLLLSTATATQYFAWAAAAVVLISPWVGAIYNLAAGALLVAVYDSWNGGAYPWAWDKGVAGPFSPDQTIAAALVWLTLAAVVLVTLWPATRPPTGPSTCLSQDDGIALAVPPSAVPPSAVPPSTVPPSTVPPSAVPPSAVPDVVPDVARPHAAST
jgi:4-amino-4-deoxy-L-arabinose transferase-like glycosyltransferase